MALGFNYRVLGLIDERPRQILLNQFCLIQGRQMNPPK